MAAVSSGSTRHRTPNGTGRCTTSSCADHPAADRAACESVAYGVVGIALHNVFLSDIASKATGTATARAAAERLIATLG